MCSRYCLYGGVCLKAFKIRPGFDLGNAAPDPFLGMIERYINELFPPAISKEIKKGSAKALLQSLPILNPSEIGTSFSITLLCPGLYTDGVGRYVSDTLSRWIIPGKNLSITGGMSLSFAFEKLPEHKFYFDHLLVSGYEEEEISTIRQNLPSLIEEMKLNIMAVYQARYVASLRSISLDQKNLLIRENLSKILNLPAEAADRSLFDQMHHFLMKVSEEEKMGQVKRTIAQLMQIRPKSFDREVFYEMTHFTILFKEQFSSKRAARHISRVIALHYLFKKVLLDSIHKNPNERHISIKLFNTCLGEKQPVLGILVGLNVLREPEKFDKKFLLEAVGTLLPEVEFVKDSYMCDRRDEAVTILYLEVSNRSFAPFSSDEIKQLRLKLGNQLKRQIESDVHPIFLPRNEEDVARNLILLSQQLKFSRDLPQASIHYEKQTESEILFSVLLTRLRLPTTKSLRELILQAQSPIKFTIDEARDIGKLKRRIPKEAAILRVSLEKAPFFRPDYSVDLLRARQRVAYELNRIIGDYRDFNGGMILKQEESLLLLRKQIGRMEQPVEFLLEDYFYSIRPGIMQTVLPTEVLKSHFTLLQTLQRKNNDEPYEILEESTERFYLLFIGSADGTFKDKIDIEVEKLKLPSYELASCFVQMPSLVAAGYVLRTDDQLVAQSFRRALERGLNAWSKNLFCPVKAI